jgi:hypothetical protein
MALKPYIAAYAPNRIRKRANVPLCFFIVFFSAQITYWTIMPRAANNCGFFQEFARSFFGYLRARETLGVFHYTLRDAAAVFCALLLPPNVAEPLVTPVGSTLW